MLSLKIVLQKYKIHVLLELVFMMVRSFLQNIYVNNLL